MVVIASGAADAGGESGEEPHRPGRRRSFRHPDDRDEVQAGERDEVRKTGDDFGLGAALDADVGKRRRRFALVHRFGDRQRGVHVAGRAAAGQYVLAGIR